MQKNSGKKFIHRSRDYKYSHANTCYRELHVLLLTSTMYQEPLPKSLNIIAHIEQQDFWWLLCSYCIHLQYVQNLLHRTCDFHFCCVFAFAILSIVEPKMTQFLSAYKWIWDCTHINFQNMLCHSAFLHDLIPLVISRRPWRRLTCILELVNICPFP